MAYINTYTLKENSVLYVYSIYDRIDSSPEYQRHGDLWKLEKRQLFLDSILSGYDIPKIYLHALGTPKKNGKAYAIIDGRQRLETLWMFMKNKFALGDYEVPLGKEMMNLKGLNYNGLAKDYLSLKSKLDAYKLPIVCVETENDEIDVIEEMFSRLNQAVSINSAEQRNALGGNMVKMIRNTAQHDFFTKHVKFSNKRYQHLEVAVRLLFIEKAIHDKKLKDTKRKLLNEFTKKYKTKKPEPDIFNNVGTILDKMSRIFKTNDNLLTAQGRIPIYYLLVRQAAKNRKMSHVSREEIEKFHNKVMENKKMVQDPTRYHNARQDLVLYDRLTIQGTNDASSIVTRFQIIADYFHISNSEIIYLSSDKNTPKET